MSEIRLADARMTACKFTHLNMRVGEFEENEELQLNLELGFRRVDQGGKPAGIDVDFSIKADGGRAFVLDATARAFFDFGLDASAEDAERYLAEFAPTRVVDALRPSLEAAAQMTFFPALSIPPISPVLDPSDWRKPE